MPKAPSFLLVAKIGRVVGIHGDLKLHIVSDFPSIFIPEAIFHTLSFGTLCISSFDAKRNLVRFVGFTSRESAAKLVNCELYSTLEESKAMCVLKEGEFLWQEMIGVGVYDTCNGGELKLGEIKDIERIGALDYLLIATDSKLVSLGLREEFFIPNIEHYVRTLSTEAVITCDALKLLEQS